MIAIKFEFVARIHDIMTYIMTAENSCVKQRRRQSSNFSPNSIAMHMYSVSQKS